MPAPAAPEGQPRAPAARLKPAGYHYREILSAWALLLPALLGLLAFHVLPTARAVQISLTDWNLLRPPHFVGLANYLELLRDGRFWNGMKLSACYVLLNIPAQTVLGLGLAVAMDRLTRSLLVKSVLLLPYLLSNVLVAMIWLWMLDPTLGMVNQLGAALGMERQPFFGGVDQALAAVVQTDAAAMAVHHVAEGQTGLSVGKAEAAAHAGRAECLFAQDDVLARAPRARAPGFRKAKGESGGQA